MRRTTTVLIILGILGLVVAWGRRGRLLCDERAERQDPVAGRPPGVAVCTPNESAVAIPSAPTSVENDLDRTTEALGETAAEVVIPVGDARSPVTDVQESHSYGEHIADVLDVHIPSHDGAQAEEQREEPPVLRISPPNLESEREGLGDVVCRLTDESDTSMADGIVTVPTWPDDVSSSVDTSLPPSTEEPTVQNALDQPIMASQVGDEQGADDGHRLSPGTDSYPVSLPKKRIIAPGKRGGRHRVTQKTSANHTKGTSQERIELECERHGMAWRIIVELETSSRHLRAYQGEIELEKTPAGAWVLVDLGAPVRVGDTVYALSPGQNFRVFRIGQDGRGRAVLNPSGRGTYLVVVPHGWTLIASELWPRKQSLGVAGWDGYVCETLEGLRAVDDRGRTMEHFRPEGFQVELTGKDISEFEGPGPLFVGSPPEVSAPWQMVSQVVVGHEGQAAPKWRETQKISGATWQGFPPLPTYAGWYFVRFYDQEANLLDSVSFFYMEGLRWVSMQQLQDGSTRVIVEHTDVVDIDLANGSGGELVGRSDGSTKISVPPGPLGNLILVVATDRRDGSELKLPLRLKRVSWAIESQPTDDNDLAWTGHPIRVPMLSAKPASRWSLHVVTSGYGPTPITFRVGSNLVSLPVSSEHRVVMPLHRWAGAVTNEGSVELILSVGSDEWPALVWTLQYRCARCHKTSVERLTMEQHVREQHCLSYHEVTDYQEYQKWARVLRLNVALPDTIYQCLYCNEFIRSDETGGQSMNTAITTHQQAMHRVTGRPTKLNWRVVSTMDEIRSVVKQSWPLMGVCDLCKRPILLAEQQWESHESHHYDEMIVSE